MMHSDSAAQLLEQAVAVRPSAAQLHYQAMGFIGFIHFGINTFTNQEWGDGSESPKIFNPSQCDPRQWARVAARAGMKMLILTCKHHDGFCLWPSAHSEHHIGNSPYRDGDGDLVREFTAACRAEGILPGCYLSPWDRHDQRYGSEAYNDYYVAQLEELLSAYGTWGCIWLDGACAEGPNGNQQIYDWERYYETMRRLQPNATICGVGPDVRWIGNEAGAGRESEWNVVRIPKNWHHHNQQRATHPDLGSRSTLAAEDGPLVWYPAEADTSIRSGWFYHPEEDNEVKDVGTLLNIWYGSVGRGATLLLNLPPDKRGLVHEIDASRLLTLRETLEQTFAQAIASHGPHQGSELCIELDQAQTADRLRICEDISQGQRIEAWVVEADNGEGSWQIWCSGGTVGSCRLERPAPRTVRRIRWRCTESRAEPHLLSFSIHQSTIGEECPRIHRDRNGTLTISSQRSDCALFFSTDGGSPATPYLGPIPLPRGGIVRAVAKHGDESTQEATARFGIATAGWTVHSASSNEDTADLAIDGDPQQCWTSSHGLPQCLVVDLGQDELISALGYLPRQQDHHGHIRRYAWELSRDGKVWQDVASGSFSNTVNNPLLQVSNLEKPSQARYLKLTAIEAYEGQDFMTIAGITAFAAN